MASVTDDKDEKTLPASNAVAGGAAEEPDDDDRDDDRDRDDKKPARRESSGGAGGGTPSAKSSPSGSRGFFTIHKRGQGYWTRMGTAMGAALVGFFTAYFLYQQLPVWLPEGWNQLPGGGTHGMTPAMKATLGSCLGFLVVYGIFVYWLTNRPTNVDFLIATDSEMKKVNWTSRKELIGSTKIVIIFMFLIAAFLFLVDLCFGYIFYLCSVLKTKPF